MTLLLSESLLIEANALTCSDPCRSSRLRYLAAEARRMELALDDIAADGQEHVIREVRCKDWVREARVGNVVVLRGIFADQNVEIGDV